MLQHVELTQAHNKKTTSKSIYCQRELYIPEASSTTVVTRAADIIGKSTIINYNQWLRLMYFVTWYRNIGCCGI